MVNAFLMASCILMGIVFAIFVMGVCSDLLKDHEACRPEDDDDIS